MSKQADKGNWDEDFGDDKTQSQQGGEQTERKRIEYMKIKEPGDYTIRLVGNHVKFLRHWQPFSAKDRVITHKDYKDEDPSWKGGFYPRDTYAIHVIDRKDSKLKVLEKGRSIFKEFAKYKIVNDINPAGKDGPDFVITVTGKGLKTKYSVTAKAKPAPFTPEEIAMIKENIVPLADIYKSTALDKIKELWEALPASAKVPPKRDDKEKGDSEGTEAQATKAPTKAPAKETPSEVEPSTEMFEEAPAGEASGDLF